MNLNIDIVNACNLHCPACPRGRGDLRTTTQQMSPDLLREILGRAKAQCRIHEIELYDTSEPTLHKDLPGMIRTAREYGQVCVSTNASIPGTDWDAIVAAGPGQIIISTSGARAETHAKAHAGSDLEVVHEAMEAIHAAIRRLKAAIPVTVLFHRYKYNLDEEVVAGDFVKRRYGWHFAPLWAAVLHPKGKENTNQCVLSPEQALEIGQRHPIKWCLVLERNQNIDVEGWAKQCAGFPHRKANFLTTPLSEIQAARRADPLCQECARTGMAHYVCRNPVLDYYNAKAVGDCWRYRRQRFTHWLFHFREKLFR